MGPRPVIEEGERRYNRAVILWLFVLLCTEAGAAQILVPGAQARLLTQTPVVRLAGPLPVLAGTLAPLSSALSLSAPALLTAAAPSVIPQPLATALALPPQAVSGLELLQAQVQGLGGLDQLAPQDAASFAGQAFDGGAPRTPELPSYLNVADEGHRLWVAAIVEAARQSATARRILRGVEAMVARRGRPVIIAVESLRSNNGEYVYDFEVVKMAAGYRSKEPRQAVHTLIHELLHVVQKDMVLPVDALEMELEAHIVGVKVMRELGLKPEKGSFELLVDRHFRKGGLKDLAAWLAKEYAVNISLAEGIEAYMAVLFERVDKSERRLARLAKALKGKRAVLESMIAVGQPEAMIEGYRLDEVGPVERKIREETLAMGWAMRDLELLASPEGRARAVAFGKKVRRWLRRTRLTWGD